MTRLGEESVEQVTNYWRTRHIRMITSTVRGGRQAKLGLAGLVDDRMLMCGMRIAGM